MEKKKSLTPLLITLAFSVMLTVIVLAIRKYLTLTDYFEKMAALSDAFFVPGVLLIGFGVLVFAANDGFFDIFSYGMIKLISTMRLHRRKDPDGPADFFEYRMAKHGEKKPLPVYLFIIGGIDLIAAVVFLILYQAV